MARKAQFTLRTASWEADREALSAIRVPVFVEEQAVPKEMEWDAADETALHLLAEDQDGLPIGTARLLPNGQIGRMAVVRSWRRRGVGDALLTELLQQARERAYPTVFLNAQIQAMPFYARHGFQPLGETFMEAGIPHQQMQLATDPRDPIQGRIELQGRAAFARHALQMAQQASRSIDILSFDLDPPLFDQQAFVDAVKRLATGSHQSRICILLQDNDRVQKQGHRLLELARRLPSHIAIHRPAAEDQGHPENLMIVDDSSYLLRRVHTRYQGIVGYLDRREARPLSSLFDEMWGRSGPDSDLRHLHI